MLDRTSFVFLRDFPRLGGRPSYKVEIASGHSCPVASRPTATRVKGEATLYYYIIILLYYYIIILLYYCQRPVAPSSVPSASHTLWLPLASNAKLEWFNLAIQVCARGASVVYAILHAFRGDIDLELWLSLSRPSPTDLELWLSQHFC